MSIYKQFDNPQKFYESAITKERGFGLPRWNSTVEDTYFMMMLQLWSRDMDAGIIQSSTPSCDIDIHEAWRLARTYEHKAKEINNAKDRFELYAAIKGIKLPEVSGTSN